MCLALSTNTHTEISTRDDTPHTLSSSSSSNAPQSSSSSSSAPSSSIPSSSSFSSASSPKDVTLLGSMLFSRQCSGARTVSCAEKEKIGPLEFVGWGSHHDYYPHGYITVAAAIGMEMEEVDVFLRRLKQCLQDIKKKKRPPPSPSLSIDDEMPPPHTSAPPSKLVDCGNFDTPPA
jgi:hypothetical protein